MAREPHPHPSAWPPTGTRSRPLSQFHVQVVLADKHTQIRPNIQELFNIIFMLRDELVCVAKVLPRLRQLPTVREVDEQGNEVDRPRRRQKTFFEQLAEANAEDHKTQKALKDLGLEITGQIFAFLNRWEASYKNVWEKKDKERTVDRVAKQQQPLQYLVARMDEYRQSQEEVLQEETTQNLAFLRFDLSPLKQAIVKNCDEWIQLYTALLHRMAREELAEIQAYFTNITESLSKIPTTLEELSFAVKLPPRVVGDRDRGTPAEKDNILAKFEPLQQKYKQLKDQGVTVPDEEQAALVQLADSWQAFEVMLRSANDMLVRAKESQRDRLVTMVDQFVADLAQFRQEFEQQAPFSTDGFEVDGAPDVARAFRYMRERQAELEDMRRKAESLKAGMDIFNIPEPPYKELGASEKDLSMLGEIWGVVRQWQTAFDSWKDTMFQVKGRPARGGRGWARGKPRRGTSVGQACVMGCS